MENRKTSATIATEKMHHGSGSVPAKVSPVYEYAIGIAAIVLEGRDNESGSCQRSTSEQPQATTSPLLLLGEAAAVASGGCSTSTASGSPATAVLSEWMVPSSPLQSIFRLKNKLFLNKAQAGGGGGSSSGFGDPDKNDGGDDGFLMFDSLQGMAFQPCFIPRSLLDLTTRRTSKIYPAVHSDEFLRKIGLTKFTKFVSDGDNIEEDHLCSVTHSEHCFRWQNFQQKMDHLLSRGSGVCIEVFLGPEKHPLLLEQWIIQRTDKPSTPSMTIQYLCSAIRSQMHFSQITAWTDLLVQQLSSAKPNPDVLDNPRVVVKGVNAPRLDLIYRVNSIESKHSFDRAPLVHNFPNVIIVDGTGLQVSLKSLPRLERIPMLKAESVEAAMTSGSSTDTCCNEKGKHRCLSSSEFLQKREESFSNQVPSSQPPANVLNTKHREKQLNKYKKRLLKRDKSKQKIIPSVQASSSFCSQPANSGFFAHEDYESTSINDLCLPLYTEVNEIVSNSKKLSSQHTQTLEESSCQTVATQTDFHMLIDDELHELALDDHPMMDQNSTAAFEVYLCSMCNKQMDFICWNCCDSKKFKKLKQKQKHNSVGGKNCMVRKFYRLPTTMAVGCHSFSKDEVAKKKADNKDNNNNLAVNKNLAKSSVSNKKLERKESPLRSMENFLVSEICPKSVLAKSQDDCEKSNCDNKGNSLKNELPDSCRLCKRQKTNHLDEEGEEEKHSGGNHLESASQVISNNNRIDRLEQQKHQSEVVLVKNPSSNYVTPVSNKSTTDAVQEQSQQSKIVESSQKNMKLSKQHENNLSLVNKSTSHCIKNLSNVFSSENVVQHVHHATPIFLRKLLLPPASENVFNFDSENLTGCGKEEANIGFKKSLSAPSIDAQSLGERANNSLSPRFLKSTFTYKKRRNLSERSSVCSDDLSLSDDESLMLTPNGRNYMLDSQSLTPSSSSGRGEGARQQLWRNAFRSTSILGSLEESLFQKRLTPTFTVSAGFKGLLGASGSVKQLTIPLLTYFYELVGQSQSMPYLCEMSLPRKGYTIPRQGTVQVTLLNSLGTFVHMFVVPYDFREMPIMSTTFIRQRSLMLNDSAEGSCNKKPVDQLTTEEQMKFLRYVIHLRFQTTRNGRLVLHTDIKMLISRRTDHDTAAAHARGGSPESSNELKTVTITPDSPKFSVRLDKF